MNFVEIDAWKRISRIVISLFQGCIRIVLLISENTKIEILFARFSFPIQSIKNPFFQLETSIFAKIQKS